MSTLNVFDLQRIQAVEAAPGDEQTAWSGISWSKCKGPSVLSHNNCGWD